LKKMITTLAAVARRKRGAIASVMEEVEVV
jgi:hypothetical protein